MSSREKIFISTSGWSYPKGEGTWTGYFYPTVKTVTGSVFYHDDPRGTGEGLQAKRCYIGENVARSQSTILCPLPRGNWI